MRALLALSLALTAAAAAPPAKGPAALSSEDRRRALLLADLYVEDGRLADAEKLIVERRRADPEWWDWELRLARLRNSQRRYRDAAASYQRLLRERGDDPGLLIQYGQQIMAAGDLQGARRAFEKARPLTEDPVVPYELSEIAHAQGRRGDSRRLGEEALKALEDLEGPGPGRMRLRLLARLRWHDGLEAEFGRLYDKHQDPETLVEWANALIRRGLVEAAAEPVALLRERHPRPESRWRLLELDRLRRAGDRAAYDRLLEESAAGDPADPVVLLAAGERDTQLRRWPSAESRLARAAVVPELEPSADELAVEARRRGHHHAGPLFRWRNSVGSTLTEAGAAYAGYPRRGLRLEAEATLSHFNLASRNETLDVPAANVSLAREKDEWTAGAEVEAAKPRGAAAVSPGLFGGWERGSSSVKAAAHARRAWRTSPQAAAVDARSDELSLQARARLLPRLTGAVSTKLDRYTLPGGEARQSLATPELSLAVVESPVSVALSYRFLMLDAAGQDAFFARLPLVRRARTHYAVLSAGRRWNRGRVRTDAYAYNGHEPSRGRRWGRKDLVGWGANVEWILPRAVVLLSFEDTLEVFEGVGGRSQSASAALLWRWEGPK